MQVPNFNLQQYLSSTTLNAAMGLLIDSVGEGFTQYFSDGFISPQNATVSTSGLVVYITLNPGFALSVNGVISRITSQVNYQFDVSALVPSSGSVPIYVVSNQGVVPTGPFTVVPPPPGDPSYSPNAEPYTGYSSEQYAMSFGIATTAPDNVSSFALAYGTLEAGATSFALSSAGIVVSALKPQAYVVPITQAVSLTQPGIYYFSSNVSVALPSPQISGQIFGFAGAGTITLTSGLIVGIYSAGGSTNSMVLGPNDSVALISDGTNWRVMLGTFSALTQSSFPIPLTLGGTGAISASAALSNLGGAALAGNSGVAFNVATATSSTNAVPLGQAQSSFAAKNGSSSVPFSMSNLTASTGVFGNIQIFTGSGTFSVPSEVTRVKVRGWAAGGGGGEGYDSNQGAGGGGGGGGYFEGPLSVTPNQQITVTVAPGSAPGSSGGTTSFGSLVSMSGGDSGGNATGTSVGIGGLGGESGSSTGTMMLMGGTNGQNGIYTPGGALIGGLGGAAFGSGNTIAPSGSAANGVNGIDGGFPGAGGSGGVGSGSSGGGGAAGLVIVEW